jgi:arsenate reductase
MNQRVLFVCTHNAGRSQMAEGYLRARYGDRYEAFSAGTVASVISPLAIRAMAEIGVDISSQRSKDLGEFVGEEMDVVVTVCGAAAAACPVFPGARMIHASVPDPAVATGPDEARLAAFRAVRDMITAWINTTFGGNGRIRG